MNAGTKNKLRILHLNAERNWRGGEQQLAYLIDELSQAGVYNAIALKNKSALQEYCVKKEITFLACSFSKGFDFLTALKIRNFCVQNNITIIHIHSSGAHTSGLLATWLGVNLPLVLSRRVDFTPKSFWLTRWKYNHAAIVKILCVSDKIKAIMQAYVKKTDKCITVHSGVDLHRFTSSNKSNLLRTTYNLLPTHILIGNTSALEPHKDYHTFIDTIKDLVSKGVAAKGIIIGDGTLHKQLATYAEENRLADHVIFTGFRNDLSKILPELDVFLMTSREEGLGTSILDAFAAKVPVVATAAGGIPEMVVHEHTGMLSSVGDSHDLSKNIIRILNEQVLRESIVAGASTMVLKFSKEQTAAKTLDVYTEIMMYKPPAIHSQ